MTIQRRTLRNYTTKDGREPFREWIMRLRDKKAQANITQRIERLRQGNPGDLKRISKNIYELRIRHGPGYRVYYTIYQDAIVILFCGGSKRTQQQDITRAQNYYNDFLEQMEQQQNEP